MQRVIDAAGVRNFAALRRLREGACRKHTDRRGYRFAAVQAGTPAL